MNITKSGLLVLLCASFNVKPLSNIDKMIVKHSALGLCSLGVAVLSGLVLKELSNGYEESLGKIQTSIDEKKDLDLRDFKPYDMQKALKITKNAYCVSTAGMTAFGIMAISSFKTIISLLKVKSQLQI